jgi:hypothetical protein
MMYIGFRISVAEALRIFDLGDPYARSFYDTGLIQKWLEEEKGSKLFFDYIDKGACLLGIPVRIGVDYPTIEYTFCRMVEAKNSFLYEMKNMGIDISKVNLTDIDSDEVLVENPEPYVITM